MGNKPKLYTYRTMNGLVKKLRADLEKKDFVLLYAHNGTGKTRLSMAFKEAGKSSVGNLITVQTKKLAALKTHKKSLMQKLFPSEEVDRE